jgi:hypothetical protein
VEEGLVGGRGAVEERHLDAEHRRGHRPRRRHRHRPGGRGGRGGHRRARGGRRFAEAARGFGELGDCRWPPS